MMTMVKDEDVFLLMEQVKTGECWLRSGGDEAEDSDEYGWWLMMRVNLEADGADEDHEYEEKCL